MSGGIDSSVTAWLMIRDGYDCTGATMRLIGDGPASPPNAARPDPGQAEAGGFSSPEALDGYDGGCCSESDVQDAKRVCGLLGIPHYTLNLKREFEDEVVGPFVQAYMSGLTPNPCIACNRQLKFGHLLRKARALGFDCVATGHYARVEWSAGAGAWELRRSVDAAKDQSYVLYMLTQAQLAAVRMPLGALTKQQVRDIAASLGLPTAHKAESQDICFIQGGSYADFIKGRCKDAVRAGDVIDEQGRVIGSHDGVFNFTIGQRKGIGVAASEPLYVKELDACAATVTVAARHRLGRRHVLLGDVSFISGQAPAMPLRVKAMHRYRSAMRDASVSWTDSGLLASFDEPVLDLARGQALVFFDAADNADGLVIGGGTIIGFDAPMDDHAA
jgi:tRNA-specific 2-thiouridylase